MIIFTLKNSACRICFFLVFFLSFSASADIVTFTGTSPGSWNVKANWSGDEFPTSADSVIIPGNKIVTIDALAQCGSINVVGVLNIQTINTLIVDGIATLDHGILNVGDGYLYVGNCMHIIGNGLANRGALLVSDGVVIVAKSIYFWKDAINGQTVGSDAYRLLDISDSGTITLGGTLVGPNGTDTPTLAQTTPLAFIFKGGTNNNCWCEPNNWTRGNGIPGASDNVIIPYNSIVKLSLDQSVKKINLYTGAGIELSSKTLTVTGDINNNGGIISGTTGGLNFVGTAVDQTYTGTLPITVPNIELNKSGKTLLLIGEVKISDQVKVTAGILNSNDNLTLLSTASKHANIGELLSGADVIGNVNVQVFMTGGSRGYRLISSPINDVDLAEKTFKQLQKYIIITGPGGTGKGFDQGGMAQPEALTLNLYNETTGARQSSITPIQNIADYIPAGTGFYAFFRGKQMGSYSLNSPKLNAPFVSPEDVTVTYTGPINKFDQTPISLSYSNQPDDLWNGFNLLGNPYPSTIDYEKMPRVNITDQLITLKPNGSAASYKPSPLFLENNGGNQYIQPGQAFFLISSGSASVTFQESFKAASIQANGFLSMPQEKLIMSSSDFSIKDKNSAIKILKLNLQDDMNTDETTIAFQDNRSANADQDDVLYFSGSSVSLSSISADDRKLAINLLPLKNTNEIKLSVNSTSSGKLKLNFTDLSAAEGYQVFLRDGLFPDTLFNVKQAQVYAFNIDKLNLSTYGSSRFSIIFKPEPISAPFLFTAQKKKSDVELNWTSNIAKEVNYFEVEVSSDKVLFKNISQVKNASGSAGIIQYSFVDKNPFSGVSFYRLKQYNNDGSISYSDLKMVDLSVSGTSNVPGIVIYPNPASDKIGVHFIGKRDSNITATILNVHGQSLTNATFLATDTITFEVSHLTKGIYLLELRSSDNKKVIGNSKFVVGL